ncbi:ImmA/IrrE family metallo-endopeptidase [Fusobacterium varium]|uniref:ImmA/IrrE family metallo-endopeptidase n=1 Tax=Fusobacterium varium TaxID=856 RepID=UPI002FE4A228
MNIPLRVKKLVRKYGTNDPFKLCKYLGILVIFADLGNIKGYSVKRLRKKLICINKNLSNFAKKLVCAHELGHCLYHQLDDVTFLLNNTKIIRKTYLEEEANQFAVELLYDEYLIEEYEIPDININIIEQIKLLKKM